MSLTIECGSAALGAEVHGVALGALMPEALLGDLVGAWRKHLVLVFRNQDLDAEALLRVSRLLGVLDPAPPFDAARSNLDGYPEIAVVSNMEQDGQPVGGLGSGELAWHSDMTYVAAPPVACILHARMVPPSGGDTYFLDLRAACAGLPQPLAAEIAGRRAMHDRRYTSAGTPRQGGAEREGIWHPLQVQDPLSGRPTLFLGRRLNSQIADLDAAASRELLDRVWQHATREDFVYRHAWRPGDVLLWNNVCVMHRRDAFDSDAARLLHRTQIRRLAPHWERAAWQLAAAS